MDALYDLKELLVNELEGYGKKGEMSASVLERVDMLAHAAKNLDKVIECMEESEEVYSSSPRSRHVYRGDDRGSRMVSARGRKRDSQGRYADYSKNADLADKLRDMMDEVPDERSRQEIQRLVSRMEQM